MLCQQSGCLKNQSGISGGFAQGHCQIFVILAFDQVICQIFVILAFDQADLIVLVSILIPHFGHSIPWCEICSVFLPGIFDTKRSEFLA